MIKGIMIVKGMILKAMIVLEYPYSSERSRLGF
jgi:hypothetical protein